jgi:ribonuclease-3
LGDGVLGCAVADELYARFPQLSEGKLTRLRASLVREEALAEVAKTLGLGEFLHLGEGELAAGPEPRPSILADALEALLGAIHLGGGLDMAAAIVHRLFDPLLVQAATRGAGLDWKTSLQELAASQGLGPPSYLVQDDGPDHAKTFAAAVLLAGDVYGKGTGRTKKAAEQEAAEAAWRALSTEG